MRLWLDLSSTSCFARKIESLLLYRCRSLDIGVEMFARPIDQDTRSDPYNVSVVWSCYCCNTWWQLTGQLPEGVISIDVPLGWIGWTLQVSCRRTKVDFPSTLKGEGSVSSFWSIGFGFPKFDTHLDQSQRVSHNSSIGVLSQHRQYYSTDLLNRIWIPTYM